MGALSYSRLIICTVSVTGVKITTARNRTLYNIVPHGFPPTRYVVQKESEDDVVEYVQVRYHISDHSVRDRD